MFLESIEQDVLLFMVNTELITQFSKKKNQQKDKKRGFWFDFCYNEIQHDG